MDVSEFSLIVNKERNLRSVDDIKEIMEFTSVIFLLKYKRNIILLNNILTQKIYMTFVKI